MFSIFTEFADWIVYGLLQFPTDNNTAHALHFFIEDVTKILFLLVVIIYIIAWLRASLNVERVRLYLSGKNKFVGYILGAGFGAVTPFCSCSSIPLFLGFTSAKIPVGVSMAFLITSPIINEIAVILLGSLLGWKFTLLYVGIGLLIGIIGGIVFDLLRSERWLQPFVAQAYMNASPISESSATATNTPTLSFQQRHTFAKEETFSIFQKIWIWVLVGIGVGAALHGYVPENWITTHLGDGQWWSVPASVILAIPLYTNATAVIPVMESLLLKGLPIGTTLAFCMSAVAASFPEFVMLKQVMTWRLLAVFIAILLVSFTLVGWVFNILAPYFMFTIQG